MSTIKVNTITKRTGSTLTLGESGTTVTLACGATQSGFGRAGSVNWCSTIYTNSPGTVTATSGKGFFLNTTSGAITINLPSSPSFGDIVAIKDYANTFDSNNVTVGRGGSKINGLCLDATLSTEGDSTTLVYVDGTRGWLNVNTDDTVTGNLFVEATGGTVTTCGNFKVHTFTSSGCFQVTDAGQPAGSNTVDYFVVAGGGGGGHDYGSGGGAGGFRLSNTTCMPAPQTSPLVAPNSPSPAAIPVSVQTYPITVGAGGSIAPSDSSTNGANSIFSTITSAGGGRGKQGENGSNGVDGGSGGGAPGTSTASRTGGSGNTPPVSPPQGNNGGTAPPSGGTNQQSSAGGGGAGAVGGNSSTPTTGTGGDGSFVVSAGFAGCNGTTGPVCGARYFAGGASGGGSSVPTAGAAGVGGGGKGSTPGDVAPTPGPACGSANTGGGGGGRSSNGSGGGAGGSGIVIIRYKFQ